MPPLVSPSQHSVCVVSSKPLGGARSQSIFQICPLFKRFPFSVPVPQRPTRGRWVPLHADAGRQRGAHTRFAGGMRARVSSTPRAHRRSDCVRHYAVTRGDADNGGGADCCGAAQDARCDQRQMPNARLLLGPTPTVSWRATRRAIAGAWMVRAAQCQARVRCDPHCLTG